MRGVTMRGASLQLVLTVAGVLASAACAPEMPSAPPVPAAGLAAKRPGSPPWQGELRDALKESGFGAAITLRATAADIERKLQRCPTVQVFDPEGRLVLEQGERFDTLADALQRTVGAPHEPIGSRSLREELDRFKTWKGRPATMNAAPHAYVVLVHWELGVAPSHAVLRTVGDFARLHAKDVVTASVNWDLPGAPNIIQADDWPPQDVPLDYLADGWRLQLVDSGATGPLTGGYPRLEASRPGQWRRIRTPSEFRGLVHLADCAQALAFVGLFSEWRMTAALRSELLDIHVNERSHRVASISTDAAARLALTPGACEQVPSGFHLTRTLVDHKRTVWRVSEFVAADGAYEIQDRVLVMNDAPIALPAYM